MNKFDNLCRILVVLVVFVTSALPGCTPTGKPERTEVRQTPVPSSNAGSTGGPPPLVVDSDTPLLLDEPTPEQLDSTGMTTKATAENATCFVCHANYRYEALVSQHAKANIGCAVCHGQSFEHKNDENNTTPPEKMYPADKIDSFCQGCHNSHDVPAGKVVALWTKRNPDKTDPSKIVCTDCHGDHRIKVRTIIWDKKTGKLLRTNRGQ
jgi:hypothetical protein